jgi:hypothetical protein
MADEAKKMADDKKTLEQQNAQRQKEMDERNKTRGKPTPTQMENDLAKMGNHPDLEPDGSPPDPNQPVPASTKEVHAGSGGSYATRQVSSAPGRKSEA